MLKLLIKPLGSKLNGLLIVVALTGFVCTHKIQAEDECLSSNVLCYECDSRYDRNCADPFDFSPTATSPEDPNQQQQQQQAGNISEANSLGDRGQAATNFALANSNATNQQHTELAAKNPILKNDSIPVIPRARRKKLPAVAVCHGCCVKLTSKGPDGGIYVKRTCTTNLQINYFMVGLVCMKESGDRGKMCFCETDYCNGQPSSHLPQSKLVLLSIIVLSYYMFSLVQHRQY